VDLDWSSSAQGRGDDEDGGEDGGESHVVSLRWIVEAGWNLNNMFWIKGKREIKRQVVDGWYIYMIYVRSIETSVTNRR
jgi:hypothetical protein